MIGMWNGQQNRQRLAHAEAQLAKLRRKSNLTDFEREEEIPHYEEVVDELSQWLADLHRIEG